MKTINYSLTFLGSMEVPTLYDDNEIKQAIIKNCCDIEISQVNDIEYDVIEEDI